MQELSNLITIFNKKLFRIPDYQRGYAWLPSPQLTDFWEDIMTLESTKNHYTGVLTMEQVSKSKYKQWTDDLWMIENKGYVPYFIVDGQQRLTTCIILIQALIEVARKLKENDLDVKNDFEICDTSLKDIRREFIFQKKSDSILRSYIFGYEKDNPSYEFLKTKIFREKSTSDENIETLYTHNLENAKRFFIDNLEEFDDDVKKEKIEEIFRKVTQHLMFNEYIISSDIDVYVAFETMNNRGKKLSDLELLKNRLIYLSTLYDKDENEKTKLRNSINNSWKDVYFHLGRSKLKPLNDDDFLRGHWIMYFKYSRKRGNDYINFLLNDHFTSKNVLELVPLKLNVAEVEELRDDDFEYDENESDESINESKLQSKLTIKDISKYALSLKESIKHWYNSFNPINNEDLTEKECLWLDRLNRIGISYFRPLIMSSFLNKDVEPSDRIRLFNAIERFIFIAFRLSQARSNYRNSEFYNKSRDLYYGKCDIDDIINKLNERLEFTFDDDGKFKISYFNQFIDNKFRLYNKDGFYGWSGIRYFLYEYEQDLFQKSKSHTPKIRWDNFVNEKDWVTIEHILPQTADKQCWIDRFEQYSENRLNILTNSLGNLLALSQAKNSSLQNQCYSKKRADKDSEKGYFNGSFSENRVAELYEDWRAENIKERGIELLNFMERRWKIDLGGEERKIELLHLGFVD